jgi:hypothetical protein
VYGFPLKLPAIIWKIACACRRRHQSGIRCTNSGQFPLAAAVLSEEIVAIAASVPMARALLCSV